MSKPGFDAGSLRQHLQAAGLLSAFDEAVRTLDVTRVLGVLREAALPDVEAKRAAAAILVEAAMEER